MLLRLVAASFSPQKRGEGTRCAFRLAMDEQRRMLPPLFVRSRGGNSPFLHTVTTFPKKFHGRERYSVAHGHIFLQNMVLSSSKPLPCQAATARVSGSIYLAETTV